MYGRRCIRRPYFNSSPATRNGVEMTEVAESATPDGALQFKTSADGKITIGTNANAGEVFVFTVKAGDAAPVTITCKVS